MSQITIVGLDPLALLLIALGCLLWRYGGQMKRRSGEDRRFGGRCDDTALLKHKR